MPLWTESCLISHAFRYRTRFLAARVPLPHAFPYRTRSVAAMAEAIANFQSQLSGVMETVFKAAIFEITRLVEDSFLEEMTRCREQVETLRKRLKWSEGRRGEGDARGRCKDCGRRGPSGEKDPGQSAGHSAPSSIQF